MFNDLLGITARAKQLNLDKPDIRCERMRDLLAQRLLTPDEETFPFAIRLTLITRLHTMLENVSIALGAHAYSGIVPVVCYTSQPYRMPSAH